MYICLYYIHMHISYAYIHIMCIYLVCECVCVCVYIDTFREFVAVIPSSLEACCGSRRCARCPVLLRGRPDTARARRG